MLLRSSCGCDWFTLYSALELIVEAIERLFKGFDFVGEDHVFVSDRVVPQSGPHVHLAEEVNLLINLGQLLLELEDVFLGVRVELFKLFSSLREGFLLIRLPRFLVFQLYLGL